VKGIIAMKISLRHTLKSAAAATMTAGLLAVGAAAASAHVTVEPSKTNEGGYAKLTFNVPNESPTAKTNRLEVKLPTDTPLTSVSVKPIDGWKAEVVTTQLPKPVQVGGATVTKAPTSVVWTADEAHQIGQNEFQTFTLSVGILPAAGTTVTLPAAQGYTDGTTVNWADQEESGHGHSASAGSDEVSHPAPSFVTTAAAAPASPTDTPAAASVTMSSNGGDTAGWFGLTAGLFGLAAGVTALARTRPVKGN
jgi:uncharacterized protein YcnI